MRHVCHLTGAFGNYDQMTVMGDAGVNGFSDVGSIPTRSITQGQGLTDSAPVLSWESNRLIEERSDERARQCRLAAYCRLSTHADPTRFRHLTLLLFYAITRCSFLWSLSTFCVLKT